MKMNKASQIHSAPSLTGRAGGESVLILELVIITVVAWVVFDPAVVNLYYRSLPLGYDTSCLLYGECTVSPSEEASEEEMGDPYNITEERRQQMTRQLTTVEGVESAYLYDQDLWSIGHTNETYSPCRHEADTLYMGWLAFIPDSHFFETYGLQPLPGSPSAEELSCIKRSEQKVVLTRTSAIALFGSADVVGRRLTFCYNPENEVTVAGVVEDIRKSLGYNMRSLIFQPENLTTTRCRFVIRLKHGVDVSRFVEEHGRDLIRNARTNYTRVSSLMTYDDHLQQLELDEGRTQEVNRSLALTLFFLLNLCLAVIGTVWLHAKRRTEECGVRRAFGATKLRLHCEMLLRNAALATAAVAVGLIIYLNYAHSGYSTLENGFTYNEKLYVPRLVDIPSDMTWPDHFWPHFLIVSACVYLIILVTVLIGTAIPALRIVHTKVTDALREE